MPLSMGFGPLRVGILVSPGCNFISVMFLKAWSIQNYGYDLRKPKSKSWLTIASLPNYIIVFTQIDFIHKNHLSLFSFFQVWAETVHKRFRNNITFEKMYKKCAENVWVGAKNTIH